MPTSIPQEIKDEIIKRVHDDKDTLKACSLASRTFLSSCQKQLFFSVLLLPPKNKRRPTATQFEELLKSSPHLGQYVRYLEIFDCSSYLVGSVGKWDEWLSKDTALSFCLPLLTHLRGLVINYSRTGEYRDMESYDARCTSMVQNGLLNALQKVLRLPSLKLLHVGGLPFALVQHSQSLEHLALHRMKMVELDSWNPPEVSTPKVHLESLFFTTIDSNPIQYATFEEALRRRFDLTSLRRLSAQAYHEMEGHRQVWNAMKECLRTLEEFVLAPCFEVKNEIKDPIEWAKLSSLKSLDIRMRCDYFSEQLDNESASFLWLLDSLTKMSSGNHGSCLEKILIQINYATDGEAVEDDVALWKGLIQLLRAKDRFPCLRQVDLRIADSGEAYDDEDEVPDILPHVEKLAKTIKDPSPRFKVSLVWKDDEHPGFSPDSTWAKTRYFDLNREF